jgi:hypothetical protein
MPLLASHTTNVQVRTRRLGRDCFQLWSPRFGQRQRKLRRVRSKLTKLHHETEGRQAEEQASLRLNNAPDASRVSVSCVLLVLLVLGLRHTQQSTTKTAPTTAIAIAYCENSAHHSHRNRTLSPHLSTEEHESLTNSNVKAAPLFVQHNHRISTQTLDRAASPHFKNSISYNRRAWTPYFFQRTDTVVS